MRFGSEIKLIIALVLAAWPASAGEAGRAQYLGSYVWRMNTPWFGGFSAIHVHENGTRMIALSDRATIVSATIQRDGKAIASIEDVRPTRLKSSKGINLAGRVVDSEGLAILPDGTICISFEGIHRVACHEKHSSKARVLPRPKSFRSMSLNKSLEALAVDTSGRLYTMPERGFTTDGDIPVYRLNGQVWSLPFTLPPSDGYLPVAADFGPDGRLYVLERAVGFPGFRSRLRRWDIVADTPGNEQILLETATGTHDNLEGLSVWRDTSGRLRATMISDDNFLFLQRTELVEYALPD